VEVVAPFVATAVRGMAIGSVAETAIAGAWSAERRAGWLTAVAEGFAEAEGPDAARAAFDDCVGLMVEAAAPRADSLGLAGAAALTTAALLAGDGRVVARGF
jgi:hypothetical protein